MRYAFEIRKIPEATPLSGISVAVRQVSDHTTITSGTTDANGYVSFTADGHYPPFYLYVTGVTGGDKYWRSDEHHGAGPFSLSEIPHALRAMGDGVIRDHLNSLAPTRNNLTLSLDTGTALVAGYPVHNGTADQFLLTRPVSSTRIDRLVAWVKPLGAASNPGEAGFSVRTGVEGDPVTALVQTADLHEVGLAQVTVPTAGALTLTDERLFVTEQLPDQDVDTDDQFITTDTGGVVVTDLGVTLDIPRAGNYVVVATVSGQQVETQVITDWILQATYGPTFNALAMSNPGQVAVDSTGRVLIADTGNDRLVILTSAGVYSTSITSLTGITGVCVDASDNIYVNTIPGGTTLKVRKYDSLLNLQWETGSVTAVSKHLATDGTHVYITLPVTHLIRKILCSTGASVTNFGGPGTGNGQFNTPTGICVDGAYVWVADTGNSRLQQFSLAGSFVGAFSTPSPPAGITSIPTASILIVSFTAEGVVRRYVADATGSLIDSFSLSSPRGVDVTTDDTDIIWVSTSDGTVAKWDEAATPGGYGQIAVELDGSVSDYVGIGNRDGVVSNAATATVAGGSTVVIRAFAKATAATLTLRGLVLSARAAPQR